MSTTTTDALRELADVIDLIDQLGAQLEAAWIRHGELCAAVDASSTLVLHRRRTAVDREIATAGAQLTAGGGLDKALDKALDKVEPATEVHQLKPVSTPAPAPIVISSQKKPSSPKVDLTTEQKQQRVTGTHLDAIRRYLREHGVATTAEIAEAMVRERGAGRKGIFDLLALESRTGRLRRVGHGRYALPLIELKAKA